MTKYFTVLSIFCVGIASIITLLLTQYNPALEGNPFAKHLLEQNAPYAILFLSAIRLLGVYGIWLQTKKFPLFSVVIYVLLIVNAMDALIDLYALT